jgi:hypothetical protein
MTPATISTSKTGETMFDSTDVETLDSLIRMKDPTDCIKYNKVSYSELGGSSISLFVNASADNKEEWVNGIFHNSRYAIFSIQSDKGVYKLELISNGLNMSKFRKCKIKNLDDISDKVVAYFAGL